MYTPHQAPWTIPGAADLLRQIFAEGNVPFYLTVDVGHMSGQRHFQTPTRDSLTEAFAQAKAGRLENRLWLGLDASRELFDKAVKGQISQESATEQILQNARQTPYLFAAETDTSPYNWLKALGCYSPIVHLQQNDGKSSPHWPFDARHNAQGIIRGKDVLQSLYESFCQPEDPTMPPKCSEVALTLEPFISTAGDNYTELRNLEASVAYWRQFIPKDGMLLSEVVTALPQNT